MQPNKIPDATNLSENLSLQIKRVPGAKPTSEVGDEVRSQATSDARFVSPVKNQQYASRNDGVLMKQGTTYSI